MANTLKAARKPGFHVTEQSDTCDAGGRISDAMDALDGLLWAANHVSSKADVDMILGLLRAAVPSVGAALEASNDALGCTPIGRFVYSHEASIAGATMVEARHAS
jgi:hypothetical protein